MPLNIKLKGLGQSVLEGSTAGRAAKTIAFHKAPKPSLNPKVPSKPLSFRRYNPIKVAIHQRGSKKSPKGLKGIVQQQNGSINTQTPGASGIAFGGE
jgi:hypothetical protein